VIVTHQKVYAVVAVGVGVVVVVHRALVVQELRYIIQLAQLQYQE